MIKREQITTEGKVVKDGNDYLAAGKGTASMHTHFQTTYFKPGTYFHVKIPADQGNVHLVSK